MNSAFVKALVWAILIFIGSSLSGETLSEVKLINIPGFDKFIHFTWYFFLFLFLAAGIYKQLNTIKFKQLVFILIICTIYGGFLELMQGTVFTKRSEDLFDFIANCSGALVATLLFSTLYKIRFWKKWL